MSKYLVIHRHEAFNGMDFWVGPNCTTTEVEAHSPELAAESMNARSGQLLVLPMAASKTFTINREIVSS